jgi:hypothetical protein
MAKVNTKELAQCLALSYFAEHPKYEKPVGNKDTEHAVRFYTLFSGRENVTNYKKKYLSNTFPIDKVKKEFAVTKTATGKLSFHTTAKKVYNVARACVESRMFKYPLDQYEFLDQDDPFTLMVKDTCLTNIKNAFGFPKSMKIDIFSSVDVFFVKSSEKKNIMDDFKHTFNDPKTILRDGIWGKSGTNDYASMMGEYMKKGTLIPVSLKLPNNVTSLPKVKLVSLDTKNYANEDIDPFMKMLAAILHDPSKTKQIINTVIDIDFDKFTIGEQKNLSWIFPVNFNFKDLVDPKTGEPIEKYNLRFNLHALLHSAGWNGQFDASTKMYRDTQWVGGLSVPAFEQIAKGYPQYSATVRKMVDVRLAVFKDFCSKLEEQNSEVFKEQELPGLRHNAESTLSKQNVLYGSLMKPVRLFFDRFDDLAKINKKINDTPSFTQYQNEFINVIRKSNKPYVGAKGTRMKVITAHYTHAQVSYFLTEGNKSFQLYFKQRMFMTIYGTISKTFSKVFALDDYTAMKSAIQQNIQDEAGKEIIHEFKTAPHYIVS